MNARGRRKANRADLNEGTNTITIEAYWGWMYFDYVEPHIEVLMSVRPGVWVLY